MAKKESKIIREAYGTYEVLTGDAEVKRLQEIRLMSILEEKSALLAAEKRGRLKGENIGIAKGENIGKAKGIKETVKNMLKNKETNEKIILYTGISEEELKKIKEEIEKL